MARLKLGLIAMSGVRAASEELMRIGLTMPGILERGRIVASLPSLSLLTLAALTPDEFDVEYIEIPDWRARPPIPTDLDLAAISTMTAQVRDAYEVADALRANGTRVVIGGLHATKLPEEALDHVDAVVVGEGEITWPRLLSDFRAGRLERIYQPAPGEEYDLGDSPIPRFDLLNLDLYNRLTVQTSRGCPFVCDFCASSIFLTRKYKTKPVDRVIAEIRAIKQRWPRPFIEFADDNSFARPDHYKEMLRALAEEDVHWFTECDISIARDPALLDLMHAAGCRQVLIGLESPLAAGLDGVELRGNWKLRQLPRYEAAIHEIQRRGITVNGCFILGLDGDDERVFDAVYEFTERTCLFDVQITVLTPFPGTPLYDRLLGEGRILQPGAWEKCTLFDVNHRPANMSPERLHAGLIDLATRLYDPDFTQRRREGFFARRDRAE